VPVLENACVALAPVAEVPSPKLQEYEYGRDPPFPVAVNVTLIPMAGLLGEKVKLVEKGS